MKGKFEIINEKFNLISDKEKVQVLIEALTLMEHNNNRTPNDCILLAMGYKPSKSDDMKYIKEVEV